MKEQTYKKNKKKTKTPSQCLAQLERPVHGLCDFLMQLLTTLS
jgi:hypothetical protein